MSNDTIRIGFIGAGSIAQARHLPMLANLPQAQVAAVCNRTQASGEAIAGKFQIPLVTTDWRALVKRDDLDAIFIGTWPYMHREMSIAALEAGKHCFCQARMAMDLDDARQMLAAAQAHSNLVNMICPPPTRMPVEPMVRQIIQSGRLGPLTSVHLYAANDANLTSPKIHWREQVEYSGRQIMAVGIYAETLNAWVGPYENLSATLATPIRHKLDAHGRQVPVQVPQVVSITGKLQCGATATELHSGVAADPDTRGQRLTIHGLSGSLHYDFNTQTLELARAGEALQRVEVPLEMQRPWRVERDFVEAVALARQGKPWSVSPDFAEGLLYMRKMQAVHRSADQGLRVTLSEL